MKNEAMAKVWLKRAKSNLQIARAGKVFEDILFEDLCFDCEQAVEKIQFHSLHTLSVPDTRGTLSQWMKKNITKLLKSRKEF
ncbi:MAG TPA: HEPN domain-containing protein [Candidatus Methanoperedens sp.]